MALRSAWVVIDADYKNKLFVIEDIANKTGGTTITNDAENVVAYVREHFGKGWRTVYKDTDNECGKLFLKNILLNDMRLDLKNGTDWLGIFYRGKHD